MADHVLRFPDGGWAELVGNHPALDLLNTVAWRPDPARRVDRLGDARDLVRWAEFAGVLNGPTARRFARETAADPAAAARVLERVRRLRERLHRVVLPLARDQRADPTDVVGLHTLLLQSLQRVEVVSTMPTVWSSRPRALAELPDQLAVRAWQLLQRDDADRLRQCGDDSCGWLFIDRSRSGTRVWCSSADCGNRSRVRRHYRLHHDPRVRQER
ncbi:MAG: CGNR zinc finger domain-containing protein [Nocardioides sp.]